MNSKLLSLLFLFLAVGGSDLRAQARESQPQRQPQEQGPMRDQIRQRIVDRFDVDGDGRLNPIERRAARLAFRARRQAMQASGEGVRARLLKRFDVNGDGRLDESERVALRETIQQRRAQESSNPEAKTAPFHPKRENVDGQRFDRRRRQR